MNEKNMVKNRILLTIIPQKLAEGLGHVKLLLACLFLID